MRHEAEFYIPGIPKPQGSMRHVGRGRIIHSSPALLPWRERIVQAILDQECDPFDGPVHVRIHVFLPIPKKPKHRLPISRATGDIDKHARCTLDALQLSGIIPDDSHVVDLHVCKRYSENVTGVGITIRNHDEPTPQD